MRSQSRKKDKAKRDDAKKKREAKEQEQTKRRFETVMWDEVKDTELKEKSDDKQLEEAPFKKRRRMSREDKENVGDYLAHYGRFNVSEIAASAILNLQQKQQNKEQRFTQSQLHMLAMYPQVMPVEQPWPQNLMISFWPGIFFGISSMTSSVMAVRRW